MRSRYVGRNIWGKNQKNRAALLLVLIFALLGMAMILLNAKIKPIIRQYATSRITYLATSVINAAINDELVENGEMYRELISFEKNEKGDILALKTDGVAMNFLKSAITSSIAKKISNMDTSDISIPIGNIINSELFSGRGPKIPIRLIPLGSAKAELISAFTNAGINQTRHQIIVEATVSMSVVLPGTTTACKVSTQMNIAETVIVGHVPESYTYIDDTSASILEKFNNYQDSGMSK